MATVSRRFRRNIQAKNLATKVGIVPPVVRYKMADGSIRRHIPRVVPPVFYRATMLRVLLRVRNTMKARHHAWQVKQGRRSKVSAFFGEWSKSWLRRFLEKLFPSLRQEVRAERKVRRERLRHERGWERAQKAIRPEVQR